MIKIGIKDKDKEVYEMRVADFFKIKIQYFDYGPKKNLEIFLDKSGKKTKINEDN